MCNLFFFLNKNPKPNTYKLIIANNRDEFYNRATANAHIWETNPKIIAGKDLLHGGTWLCASENGKVGCLLNILQPPGSQLDPDKATSRGDLVLDFCKGQSNAQDFISHHQNVNQVYNKFNLVLIEPVENRFQALMYNNSSDEVARLNDSEIYGFGNNIVTNTFRKVEEGRKRFENVVKSMGFKDEEELLIQSLTEAMKNEDQWFPDPVLQNQSQGLNEEFQKGLSRSFVSISAIGYGTRTMSVILIDNDNKMRFHEETMVTPSSNCDHWQTSDFTLQIS